MTKEDYQTEDTAESDHITDFLEENGDYEVLATYRRLKNRYGEELETDLEVDSEDLSYNLSVTVPIREKAQRNGQESGNGTDPVSRLLDNVPTTNWPKEFSGKLEGVN